ncbi:hypothetical protein GCM10009623_33410 [Nocardioides aestuarii]|uniref:Lysyl oxidase family protein n=1 Tax=Nocardioides aestuarii TaxID=252231 RepID=A0ABW4TRA1_9ACTN
MPAQHHRRTAAVGLAVAALAAGALTTSPSATAAPTESPIRLMAPDSITVRSHDGYVYSDFGLEMAAQNQDFEIRANRASYDDPIVAVWKSAGGDVPIEGEGTTMSSWQGLDGFLKVVVRKVGRKRPVSTQDGMTGCFNSWSSRAVAPDHASGNDYPWNCPYNPYTQGSVMGIAKGFAVSALGDYGYYASKMKPGDYRVKATIAPAWQEFFGISAEDATSVTAVRVRKGRDGWRPAQRTAPDTASGQQLEENPGAPAQESAGALANEFAPDLEALPAFGIGMNRKGTAVRFGANVWNGGNGPLVVEGFEPDTAAARAKHEGEEHLDAYQYYFDGNGEITGHDLVGEFTFHEGNHNHWHYEDFAAYTLLNEDMTEAVRSSKVSFCLANTDAIDYTIEHADWRPENTDLSSDCGGRGATYLREVLSAGSGDTYYQYRTGQAFRVGNLPDGDYWISVEANPFGRLQELDTENNQSLRKITLSTNKRGIRKVTAEQVGVIQEDWGYYRSMRNAG